MFFGSMEIDSSVRFGAYIWSDRPLNKDYSFSSSLFLLISWLIYWMEIGHAQLCSQLNWRFYYYDYYIWAWSWCLYDRIWWFCGYFIWELFEWLAYPCGVIRDWALHMVYFMIVGGSSDGYVWPLDQVDSCLIWCSSLYLPSIKLKISIRG